MLRSRQSPLLGTFANMMVDRVPEEEEEKADHDTLGKFMH